MIDLRSNILDGTDCGPQSFAESLEMCRVAVECGVRTVVATPRWKAGSLEPPLPFEEINQKIERLQRELGDTLSIKSGFVFESTHLLLNLINRYGRRLALGEKRHLLISLPSNHLPTDTDEIWAGLRQRGFLVILAHPECCPAIRRNPALLNQWASSGVMFQIDAASVAGVYGRHIRKFALECLRKYDGCAVIASNVRDIKVNPMKDARKEISARMGDLRATKFLSETPTAIIGEGFLSVVNGKAKDSGKVGLLLRSLRQIKTLVGEA
jgi:protein-tyrosine phosphatase